jgi:hypothetical protein
MDPYRPDARGAGGAGEVLIRKRERRVQKLIEVQRPAGDGLVTAFDGTYYHLLDGESRLTLPPDPVDGDTFEIDEDFDIRRAWRRVVLPALQMAALRAGGVAVHSSSVEVSGRGVVIAGWSESGKTETALALAEQGAIFLSDKWTVLHDGSIFAFPISAGIRSWVLEYLPAFRTRLKATARMRLGVSAGLRHSAAGAGKAVAGTRLAPWASRLKAIVGLADRASLTPSGLSRALGQPDHRWSSQLETFVVLMTVPGERIEARPCEASWAARKMARSALYERREFFDLFDRAAFASWDFPPLARQRAFTMEESRLANMLGDLRTIQVRAPFPVDPRRVADAIQQFL